ncbi:MAG: hypothetical protein MO846_06795 [Candidatus Devosia symbiotica]|nr:hypothetical protein [Candidatus Devosia symbiotica]
MNMPGMPEVNTVVMIDRTVLRPYVTAYLTLMGDYILYRAFQQHKTLLEPMVAVIVPLGIVAALSTRPAVAVGARWWPRPW